MIDTSILDYAASLAPCCDHELRLAEEHFNNGLYTECVLRMGRACEAALYAAASQLGVLIAARSISQLKGLRDKLDNIERDILRTGSLTSVTEKLPDAAKVLSKAIAELSSKEEARAGQPDDNARPHSNVVLLVAIQRSLSKEQQFQTRRFSQIKGQLENFQKRRNRTAHARPDGVLSECDEQQAKDAITFLNDFLGDLFEAVIADRARLIYAHAS